MSENKLSQEQLEKVNGGEIGVGESYFVRLVEDTCVSYNYWLYDHDNEPRSVKRAKVSQYMNGGTLEYGEEAYQYLVDFRSSNKEYWEETIDWITDKGYQKRRY